MTNAPPWNHTMTGRLPVVCAAAGAYMFSDKQSSEMNGVPPPGKNCVFCGHEGPYCSAENGVENRAFLTGFEKRRLPMGGSAYGTPRNVLMRYVVELNVEVFSNPMIVPEAECTETC